MLHLEAGSRLDRRAKAHVEAECGRGSAAAEADILKILLAHAEAEELKGINPDLADLHLTHIRGLLSLLPTGSPAQIRIMEMQIMI